jgi:S-adenosylhomocysteine hydrolase
VTSQTDPLGWAREHCPILTSFQAEYGETEPFDGSTVAVATHLEEKSGVFIETLHEAGAEVLFAPSEPQSTKAAVLDAFRDIDGITAFARHGMSDREFDRQRHALLEREPDLILGDGCGLIAMAHADHPAVAKGVIGGAEQTTVGVTRVESMAEEGALEFPVYTVNHTPMKHRFDNIHGTGESVLTNIAATTNTMLAGTRVVIAGYGYCGRGIARKARDLGAKTIVTEVDPRKALEAHTEGHDIMPMTEAASRGELFITATGTRGVIRREHIEMMPDGAVLANAGHFDVEIQLDDLETLAVRTSTPTEGVTRYQMGDDRSIDVLADGRLVNLTGPHSRGHPAEVIDTTHAMMFEAGRELVTGDRELPAGAHPIPDRLDRAVAERKLETMDATIDESTDRQQAYDADWRVESRKD